MTMLSICFDGGWTILEDNSDVGAETAVVDVDVAAAATAPNIIGVDIVVVVVAIDRPVVAAKVVIESAGVSVSVECCVGVRDAAAAAWTVGCTRCCGCCCCSCW